MKKILLLSIYLMTLLNLSAQNDNPLDDVAPIIGTGSLGDAGGSILDSSNAGHGTEYGGTVPWVTVPFGMTNWAPMTQRNQISSTVYKYSADKIVGFTATRQPAIWMGDYGHFALMPCSGTLKLNHTKRGLKFSHKNEQSAPNLYSVKLKDGLGGFINVQISSTSRCSIMEIDFSQTQGRKFIVIDASYSGLFDNYSSKAILSGEISIDQQSATVAGFNRDRQSAHLGYPLKNFAGHFLIASDTPFTTFGTYRGLLKHSNRAFITGDACGGWIEFPEDTDKVTLRIGTSLIDRQQAQSNLTAEIGSRSLTATAAESAQLWNTILSKIQVTGGNNDQRKIFYTGLYHASMFPREFSEDGRYYSAFDDKIHNGVTYSDFSLWDTFRALHPLLIFTAPERVRDMIISLLNAYQEGGWLPKWPNPSYTGIMIGSHAESVIADALVKGINNFDTELAYEAVYKSAMEPQKLDKFKKWMDRGRNGFFPETKGGLYWYKKLGYVPSDKAFESVSRTLEFAYGDFCASVISKYAGHDKEADFFLNRSKNYKNVYKDGFVNARSSTGNFGPNSFWHYTEGSPWTYQFCVMHDITGLVDFIGRKKFISLLDRNFEEGHSRHDNEPGHHYAYLYNYAGIPSKTQKYVSETCSKYYANHPVGYLGNEDCGQMSAWYIFSSMGFYPVTPGTETYAIGTPLFPSSQIQLSNGLSFKITTENHSSSNIYVKELYLNGKPLKTPFITHSQIMQGSELHFVMTDSPDDSWWE